MAGCECLEWLLLALDEWKASREYARMGEQEKSGDESKHFRDFQARVMEKCPSAYRELVEKIMECEK